MSKRSTDKRFHFSFAVLIRLVIFTLIITLLINYFTNSKLTVNVPTPNLVQYLPPKSQQVLGQTTEYLNSTKIPDKIEQFQKYVSEFPQKHLQQFKIDIINRIAQELVDRIQTK